jgi:hypothetical protein
MEEDRQIYIYGTGYYGIFTALEFEQKGIKIAGFIDANANQIKTRLGLPVLAPSVILTHILFPPPYIVIAVKNAAIEIKNTLQNAGLKEGENFEISKIAEREQKSREIMLEIMKEFDQKPREIDFAGQAASDLIYEHLAANRPCMVARFGNTELSQVVEYLCFEKRPFEYNPIQTINMIYSSGFLSADKKNLDKFSKLMLECMPKVDVLGSWMSYGTKYEFGHFRNYETYVKDYLQNAKFVNLGDLSGFHKDPWSRILEGKTVLVIHPFEQSIRNQYAKRELLFKDNRMLPNFNLKIIKAVQSIAGTEVPFKDWFAAFDFMKEQIARTDFEIAIIGCGAYGFPLGAFIKDLGKKAVHLGGATQLLFGIRGRRWDIRLENECKTGIENGFWTNLFNEHWIHPNENETPKGKRIFEDIEGTGYW